MRIGLKWLWIKNRLWALVNTVKNIQIPEFLSQLECCNFLKKHSIWSLQVLHNSSLPFSFLLFAWREFGLLSVALFGFTRRVASCPMF